MRGERTGGDAIRDRACVGTATTGVRDVSTIYRHGDTTMVAAYEYAAHRRYYQSGSGGKDTAKRENVIGILTFKNCAFNPR